MDNTIKNNIISDLGIDTLPPEKQEEVLARVGEAIFQAVMARAIEQLSDEDAKTLETILEEVKDSPESDKVMEFLQSKVANLDQIVTEEVENFKKKATEMAEALK